MTPWLAGLWFDNMLFPTKTEHKVVLGVLVHHHPLLALGVADPVLMGTALPLLCRC